MLISGANVISVATERWQKLVTVILATEKYHKNKQQRKSTENNFTITGQKNPSKIELIFGGQLPQT
jgi:hypothetical protein